ncbi:5'-3' exonuclease [Sporolactobacillus shoreae]|uniref:5'-3' exonuclease n=1 Tax=Sporolactobacillus shoreae TaxID=1465501 RepID=A0A4Z0GQ45_9BACL|nr:5'-3' exonuclease H3TH domain-containing protein [Sporolactobacillus shoreae]TGA98117.1 5'-3' exonuclease [Sporolactobacillus shoreae]
MTDRPKLLLVDGMALLFRAFYATAPTGQFMINNQGLPTNGVQGFLRHLLLAIQSRNPTHIAVCWDMGKKTFRHQMFDGYKANRAAPPVEMIPQFDLAKEMTTAFKIRNVGMAGFEADDCIGTVAKNMQDDADVSIITGDRDLLQLLDYHIGVSLLQKGYGNYRSFTVESFSEKFGVTPGQFIDVKALMGDSSDGYPGVHGIGEKTAFKLVKEFGSIDSILEHLDLLPNGQKKKIASDLEMLRLSQKLAKIKCDAPVPFSLSDSFYGGIPEQFMKRIDAYGMKLVKSDLIQMRWNKPVNAINEIF